MVKSTHLPLQYSQKTLLKALRRCDVAIGAMRGIDRTPVVVTETMVELKKVPWIVDVSIDTGGCFENFRGHFA
jgi:alanine dehydrogenase